MKTIKLIIFLLIFGLGCSKNEIQSHKDGIYICHGYIEEHLGANYRDTSNVVQKVRMLDNNLIEISDNVLISTLVRNNPGYKFLKYCDTLEYIRTENGRDFYKNIISPTSDYYACYIYNDTILINYFSPSFLNPFFTYVLKGYKKK